MARTPSPSTCAPGSPRASRRGSTIPSSAQVDDPHIQVVAHHLARHGASVFFADGRELGRGAEISFRPDAPEATEWRRRDGVTMRLGDAAAVWLRRFNHPEAPGAVVDPIERRFIRQEWAALLPATLGLLTIPTINPVYAGAQATKPRQLALALRAGLAVPETLIASSPRSAPAIFQRRVSGTRELRITVVRERVFAAEVSTPLVDGRADQASSWIPHALPAAIEAASGHSWPSCPCGSKSRPASPSPRRSPTS